MHKIIGYSISDKEIIQTIKSFDENNRGFEIKIQSKRVKRKIKRKITFINRIKKSLIIIENNICQIIQSDNFEKLI